MSTINELRTQKTKLLHDAQQLLIKDKVTKEDRAAGAVMVADAELISERIALEERITKDQDENRSAGMPPRGQPGETQLDSTPAKNEAEKRAFKNYILGKLTPEDRQHLKMEQRDMTVGAPGAVTGGGVLVPIGMDSLLHEATKATGEILSGVRAWNTDSGEGIRVSLTDPTALRFALVAEMGTVGETDVPTSGFTSYVDTLGFSTKVSNQLLQDSAFSIDSFLSDTIGLAWTNTASEAIIKGNGSNFQSLATATPVGFTAPTGDTTALTYDDLLGLYSKLDPSYYAGAAFWVNSRTWVALLGIKDSQNRPLLTDSIGLQGAPFKTLFGLPIRISQAIDDLGVSKAPVLLGDTYKSVTYRQAGPLVIRRAAERYIEQNAVGYFAFRRAGAYTTIQASSPSMIKLVMAAS